MTLEKYHKKRKFHITLEPKGIVKKSTEKELKFVVQKHEARNLHWDLRLPMAGLLKSWAVPKEPPTKPGIKRLAIHVEDHPIEYVEFSGEIPKGEYGAGKVEIWDRGKLIPGEKWGEKQEKAGELIFELQGNKMKGEYVLVKPKGMKFGKDAWLFFKK